MKMRSNALMIVLAIILILMFLIPACAQDTNIKETNLLGWNGDVWQRIEKGDILRSRMVYQEDFLGYSNTTTGVAVLAGSSAPDNSNILTPVDFYWGSSGTSGTVKLIAAVNGTVVLNTGHGAQNDTAILTWREANFGIGYKPVFETRVAVNTITDCLYEVGFYVDGNDCAMFRFNPAVSATKWLTVYENNNGGEVVYTTTSTLAVNTWVDLKIAVSTTTGALAYSVNGVVVKTYPANAIRNVGFVPRFYAKITDAGHAAAHILTVDYVRLTQDR